jgi:single-strand DNA-binding protein
MPHHHPIRGKEWFAMLTINKVILCGRITADGCRLTYTADATPHCSFTLLLEEASKQGYTYKLYIPVDLFGDKAEQAAELVNPGDLVLVDGKLQWKSWVDKQGEKQGRLVVLAWKLEKPAVPAAVELAQEE